MSPLSLTLKNFMSYGPQGETLPFEDLRVACLTGDNGNGKSALLDALTWVLWGKTRASSVGSVSEDDLIRLGAEEAEVRLEFELNDQRYRVIKKRRKGKTASASDWQLAQRDEEGGWIPIGGGSQRETGRQIVQLLNMEYDTFLNSAYLQQGKADEFTRQTPAKRKGILGEILGLNRYDRLEALAKEKYRERKEQVEEIDGEIRLLETQVARRATYQEQTVEAMAQLEEAETRLAGFTAAVGAVQERVAKLDQVAAAVEEAKAACLRIHGEMGQRGHELSDRTARVKALEAVRVQRAAIVSDYEGLRQARLRAEQLEPQIEEYRRIKTEHDTAVAAVEMERVRLEGDLKSFQAELKSVERRSAECRELDRRIAALVQELAGEAETKAALGQAEAAKQSATEVFNELRVRNERLKLEIADQDEFLKILSAPLAQCPVCESDLQGDKRLNVLARQAERQEERRAALKAIIAEGRAHKQALDAAAETVVALQMQVNDLSGKQSRLQEQQRQRDGLREQGLDTQSAQKQVDALQKQLETATFAMPRRIHAQRLKSELDGLALIRPEYENARGAIKRYEGAEKRYHQLQEAETNWDQEVAEQERLEAVLAELRGSYEIACRKQEALTAKLAEGEAVRREFTLAENQRQACQQQVNALNVQIGTLANYIRGCDEASQQKKAKDVDRKTLHQEQWLYNQLMSAFGKKGIQTFIIENAIPELAAEANELLARITDNAMQISFETTRPARSTSNEIETLDIRIQDDAGIRPYELFSGGEAFRVNFAIRIALSRLLARRAGARLQTLILDEGFGTQDGKGREKLIEAIDSIKDDFEKILVITHVDELKDAFAQRIEITKDHDG
ncbi:MAG: ATPase involved in repair, partial [Chthonomonadaceae bacterium]|nr:ATPase involved in repair [Chthonomonadaceae bacterium]